MPNTVHSGPETDWSDLPSPEQIEQWSQDKSEVSDVKSSDEGIIQKEESQKEAEPQPDESRIEEKPEPKQEPKSQPDQKKTKYQLAKEQADKERKEQEHRLNEAWKRNREKEADLTKREREIEAKAKGLDHSPEEWLKLADYYEKNGLFDDAAAARQQAEAVRQHQTSQQQQQMSQEEFAKNWQAAEQDIAKQDPMFFEKDSWVQQGMLKVLNDPETGHFFYQHPMGAWAAYWCVQTQYAQRVIPPLVKYCQELETKVQKYEKHNAPLSSSPRGVSLDDAKKFSEMDDASQAAALEKALGNL